VHVPFFFVVVTVFPMLEHTVDGDTVTLTGNPDVAVAVTWKLDCVETVAGACWVTVIV